MLGNINKTKVNKNKAEKLLTGVGGVCFTQDVVKAAQDGFDSSLEGSRQRNPLNECRTGE